VVDAYPGKREPEAISLTTGEVKRILGVEFSRDQIVPILTSLGFECQARSATEVLVTPPWWRSDAHLPVDLVEEVARITGYDKIPTGMLSQSIPRQNPSPILKLEREVRQRLTGYGFQEAISPSLVSLEILRKLSPESREVEPAPLRLSNSMNAEQEYLRPSLRANLLAILAANRRFEEGGIRLYELGKVYVPRPKDLPEERSVLCGVISGPKIEKWWRGGEEAADFFEAKGVVEGLLRQLGVEASFEPGSDESLHSSQQAVVVIDGKKLGVVGEVHSKVRENFEIAEPAYLFEIDLAALVPFTTVQKAFKPIPRFPAVVRDIALVVGAEVTHRQVRDIIRTFSLVEGVALFDVYSGEQIPAGKKSLAYRITFQSPTQTLTDEEVNKILQQILGRLSREVGAALRS
jgi:phenylalanyl-tRNA synthetase beta chain